MPRSNTVDFLKKKYTPDPALINLTNEQIHAMWKSTGIKDYKDELLLRNVNFIVSIAHQFFPNRNVEFDDFIMNGVIGFCVSLEKFTPSKNCELVTFSFFWIYKEISKSLREMSNTVRIPSNVYDLSKKLEKQISIIERSGNYDSILAYLSEQMLEEIAASQVGLTQRELDKIRAARRHMVAPSEFISETMDQLCSSNRLAQSPEEHLIEKIDSAELAEDIERIISGLNCFEKKILKLQIDDVRRTQTEKAILLGVSKREIAKTEQQIRVKFDSIITKFPHMFGSITPSQLNARLRIFDNSPLVGNRANYR